LIVAPDELLAPVMPPEITPTVHVKLLGVLAVNAILGPVPLHIMAVAAFVTTGVGLTVTTTASDTTGQPEIISVTFTV